MGRQALIVEADISVLAEAERMIEEVLRSWQDDILVDKRHYRDNLLLRMKEEDWDAVINVNLKGVFNCTKAVLRSMMKQRAGKIINVASVVGIMGNAGQTNYSASKAGVIGFTKSLAKEVASRGITANAIAPGFIESQMTEVLPEDVKEKMLAAIPLNRFGKPEEVANVVCFLASAEADYINGQVINIDGGMVM